MQKSRTIGTLAAVAATAYMAFSGLSARADESFEAKAVAASEAWLAVVDCGRFASAKP